VPLLCRESFLYIYSTNILYFLKVLLSSSHSSFCGSAESRLAHCSHSRLIVLTPLLVPRSSPEALHARRRERPLLAKGGIMGEKWPVKFSRNNATPTSLSGSFTCRKSATWDRRLYFPSEGRRAEDFFARNNRRLRPGSNPCKTISVFFPTTKYSLFQNVTLFGS
jgi:hypothetical protein